MYGHDAPEPVDLWRLEIVEACPAAGAGAGSRRPAAHLERWRALHQACVAWFNAPGNDPDTVDEISDRLFTGIDPVQREILELGFAAFLRLGLKVPGVDVDLDPTPTVLMSDDQTALLRVAHQFEVREGDEVTAVRLKTGSTGTSEVEAAAFYATAPEGMVLLDALTASDDHAVVEAPDPERAAELIGDLFARHRATRESAVGQRRPGVHCYRCDRPARCGQYPPVGGAASYRTRTIVLSKTRLATLASCERAVAWPAVYGVPRDGGDEDGSGPGAIVGSAVHEALAAALLSDDPEAVIDAAVRNAPPSEAADVRMLCERHLELAATEPHPLTEVTRVEYQMGATFLVPGVEEDGRGGLRQAPVAVVMMGTTDVNGWEGESVAAVVEHRTGRRSSGLPHEADLYAVSAWLALEKLGREVEGVAVHIHHLRRDPPGCERLFYDTRAVAEATERLRQVAQTVARWHPTDATAPPLSVGPWCEWCDHARRCLRFR